MWKTRGSSVNDNTKAVKHKREEALRNCSVLCYHSTALSLSDIKQLANVTLTKKLVALDPHSSFLYLYEFTWHFLKSVFKERSYIFISLISNSRRLGQRTNSQFVSDKSFLLSSLPNYENI